MRDGVGVDSAAWCEVEMMHGEDACGGGDGEVEMGKATISPIIVASNHSGMLLYAGEHSIRGRGGGIRRR